MLTKPVHARFQRSFLFSDCLAGNPSRKIKASPPQLLISLHKSLSLMVSAAASYILGSPSLQRAKTSAAKPWAAALLVWAKKNGLGTEGGGRQLCSAKGGRVLNQPNVTWTVMLTWMITISLTEPWCALNAGLFLRGLQANQDLYFLAFLFVLAFPLHGSREGSAGVHCTWAKGQKGVPRSPRRGARNVPGSQKMCAYIVWRLPFTFCVSLHPKDVDWGVGWMSPMIFLIQSLLFSQIICTEQKRGLQFGKPLTIIPPRPPNCKVAKKGNSFSPSLHYVWTNATLPLPEQRHSNVNITVYITVVASKTVIQAPKMPLGSPILGTKMATTAFYGTEACPEPL